MHEMGHTCMDSSKVQTGEASMQKHETNQAEEEHPKKMRLARAEHHLTMVVREHQRK